MTKSAAFHYVSAAVLAYFGLWNYAGIALNNASGIEKQRRARNRARDAYNASLKDRLSMIDLTPDSARTLALGRVRAVEGVRRRFASGEHDENLTLIVSFAGHEIDAFERFWFNDMPLQLDGSGYVTQPAALTSCSAVRDGTTATLTKTSHGLIDGTRAIISGFNLAEFNGTYEVRNATANTFQYTIPNVIGGNPSGATGTVEVRTPYKKYENETRHLTGNLDGSGEASVTLTSTPVGSVLAFGVTGQDPDTAQPIQAELTITLDSGLDYTVTGGMAGAQYSVSWQDNTGTPFVRIRTYLGTDAQSVGTDLAAEYPGKLLATDDFAGIALAVIDLTYNEDAFPQGIPNITATFRGAKCLDPRTDTEAWTENPAVHAYHYARWANGWAVPDGEIRSQDFEDAADLCDVSTDFTLGADEVTLERYRCGIVISSDTDPRQAMGDIMETMAGRWGWAGGTLRMRCGAMAAATWALDESWIAQPLGQGGQPASGPVVRISNGIPREERVNHVSGSCIDQDQRFQALPYPAVRDDVLIAADGAEYRLESDLPGISHIAHAQHLASIVIREAQAPLRMEISSNLNAYPLELFDVGTVTLARYGMTAKTMEVIGWRWRPTEGVSLRLSEITEAMYETVDELNGRDPAINGDLPSPWYVEQIQNVEVTSAPEDLVDTSVLTRTRVTWDAPVSQAILSSGKIEVQYTKADAIPDDGIDWASWREQGSSVEAVIPGLMAGSFYLFRVRAINTLGVRGPWSLQVLHQIAMPPGTGTIVLTCDPFPFFSFADGTTHTAQAPGNETLTLTARLIGIPGTATITAEAFNARTGGTSLGAVTLGGSGNVRTMTAAQFVAPGSSGSVRRVVVTARKGTLTPDLLTVYRQDSTTTDPFLYLDNPTHTVSTDSAGNNGDYSGAVTAVRVYAGLTDLTADYSTAISADDGLTATIYGLPGPVTGIADLSVAVTDSTISDGIVLITATLAASVLTAEFRVIKQLASGTGYNAYFDPVEILLPVNADGSVSTYSGATSEFFIVLGSGLADTANWSLSKEDIGVTSTLTGSTVAITAFTPLGTLGDLTTTEIPLATGWDSVYSATWCDDVWVVFGEAAGTFNTFLRSEDLETFDEVEYGSSGGDPYFSSVVLLLHFDGTNGSTTITDSSSYGHTVTITGTNAISTAESKWGGSSGEGKTSSYFEVALSTLGSMTGDFTIEGWTKTGSNTVWFTGPSGAGYLYNNAFQSYGGTSLAFTNLLTTANGAFAHWAISRVGSSIKSFINGTLIDTQTYGGTIDMSTMRIGMFIPNGNLHFTGYHDDFRVTKGVGRYTANFTTPTAAFSDDGVAEANWSRGTYGAGKLVVINIGSTTNTRVLVSDDKGLTFTEDTLSQTGVWGHVHFGDGFLVAAETSTAGSWSADADTWSNRTMPASGCSLAYAAPAWAAVSPAGALYISDDSAVTWSASLNSSMSLPGGNVVARAVGYRGAIVCALLNSTNRIVYTIDSGATFVTVILPGTYSEPRLLMAVQNVLYLVSDDLTVYSTPDGLTWTESADPFGVEITADSIYGLSDSVPLNYLPAIGGATAAAGLLIGFDGADGGSSFVDSSASPTVITAYGTAETSTDQVLFGTASGQFPTTGTNYLSAAYKTGFALGNGGVPFTVEAYVRTSGSPGSVGVIAARWTNDANTDWILGVVASRYLVFYYKDNPVSNLYFDATTTPNAVPSNTWTHVAATYDDAGTLRLFIGGVKRFERTGIAGFGGSHSNPITVGGLDYTSDGNFGSANYLKDVRVTPGAALYVADFTPPTSELSADPATGDGEVALKQALAATSADVGFVRVTGTKTGELDIVRSLPVRKSTPPAPVYTSQASPAYLILPATSDGVVTSYANATITAKIMRNNVDDSANWSWTWTATYMTPSSGSTNVATFTAMDNAQDAAIVTFVAEKPGEPLITGGIDIVKQLGTEGSGLRVGAVFNAFSATGTWIGLKFLSTGVYQVKVGSGGTYVDYGQWAGVVSAGNGALYWLRVESSGHALTSGTTGSWLAMTSDREYVLSDATSGTHTTSLTVMFADSSGGANAILSYGSLQLLVP